MSDYNQSTTATKGVQWSPALAGSVVLNSLTTSACMSVLQTLVQQIDNEKVYMGAIPTRGGLYSLEVYDEETAVPTSGLSFIDYAPNEDVSGVGAVGTFAWCDQANGTSNIYTSIDEATLNLADYIKNVPTSGVPATSTYVFRVGSASALTGKRILAVQLILYGARADGAPLDMTVGLNISSVDYSQLVTVQSSYASPIWYYNPSVKRPWRIADIQAFDSTDECFISNFACCSVESRVNQAFLRVYYVDETRLAAGVYDDSASALTANAWNNTAVLTPTGSAWTKQGASRHLYLLRRITSTGSLTIPTLAGSAAPNPARGFVPTIDPTYGYVTAMGDSTPTVFGLVQRTNAPADSYDSQPYSLQAAAKVFNGQAATQEFSNAAVASYGEVRALIAPNSATGNLLVKCKRVSDNVQFGSTITVTPAQITAQPDVGQGWRQLDVQMATAGVLATATQYYIEFSDATAADDGTGLLYWVVLCLDVGDATTGITATFGSTTDEAAINGAARAGRYDLAASISTIPTAPAGFTATVLTQTF